MFSVPHLLSAALLLSIAQVPLFAQNPDEATAETGAKPSKSAGKLRTPKPKELFSTEKVWTIHLSFSPEQWTAMEPKGGPGGFGPPGGERRPGGGAAPMRFGPSMFLAPGFTMQGDADKNGSLSGEEFQNLGQKWFASCDKEAAGQINNEQLRTGLNTVFAPPPGMMQMPPGRGSFLQGAEGKRNGVASAMGIEFNYVHADMEFEGAQFKDVAVRYKGNGTFLESRGSLKRSFKVDLNKYQKGQKLSGLTTLNLHSNVTDVIEMNEPLAHRLYRDADVPAPRTSYSRVYITVPGKYDKQYVGLYSIVEDIDKDFVDDHFGSKKGTVFKPVTPSLFTYLGDDWSKYKQTFDPKTDVTVEAAQRVIDFSRLVTQGDDAEFAAKLGEYLDLGAFARYMAVTVWLVDLDGIIGPGQNYYLHLHPKTQKFSFIAWDQDHSFGHFPRGSQAQRENLSIHKPWQGENRFLDRVFKVEAFKKLYLEKLAEFSNSIFKPERFQEQMEQIATVIRPAIQEESPEKLARFDRAVAGETDAPRPSGDGGPGPGFGPSMEPMKQLKPFVAIRAQSVRDQLANKAEGLVIEGFGPPRGGPQRPGGFGPGNFLAPVFMTAFDADRDSTLTKAEFTQGFAKWFAEWNKDGSGTLTAEQLRDGIDKTFAPPQMAPPPRDASNSIPAPGSPTPTPTSSAIN